MCIYIYRGRPRKQLKNLKQDEQVLENLLGAQEMPFVEVPDMPICDVGGTSDECEIYIENKKWGHLVSHVKNVFGTDGHYVYVAVVYAKYQHQVEYTPLDVVMDDLPKFALEVAKYQKEIEIALKTVEPKFSFTGYLGSIGCVNISTVKYTCMCFVINLIFFCDVFMIKLV